MSEGQERTVLYIGEFAEDQLKSITQFSAAGMNKKRGFIHAFQWLDYEVHALSPVFVPESGFNYLSGFESEYEGVSVTYPPILLMHPVINLIFTTIAAIFALRHYRDRGIDTVVFYNFEPQYCLPAIVAKVTLDASLFVEYEDGLFAHPSRFLAVPARVMRRLAPLDGAFLVSSALESQVPTNNTTVIRGVASVYDFPEKSGYNNDTVHLKQEGKITFLFSGGLRRGKGVETFLDAADHTGLSGRECQFVICGHGSDERKHQVQRRVAEIGSDAIEFLGTVEPWEAYLTLVHESDVLVALEDPRVLYNQYCFPSKLLEYAKTGNVVVTSDIADVNTIEPQPFVVIEEYDPAAIAASLTQITEDIQTIQSKASTASNKWLEERCSVDAVAQRIDEVVRTAETKNVIV